jgi:YbbR domain-containing protein
MSTLKKLLRIWTDKVGDFAWPRLLSPKIGDGQSTISPGEKALVLGVAYVIAIGLWLMVNLDRDFNLSMQFELYTGEMSPELALVTPIPPYVNVSINGEGWKLLNIYGSPPRIPVNLSNEVIDMTEQVQNIINTYQNINVTRVQPSIITVNLEQRISKKVPIDLQLDVAFGRQFGFIGQPKITPDSIRVTGAQSIIDGITSWPTKVYRRENLRDPISTTLELESPPEVVSINLQEINLTAEVSEFTEGELRIPLRIRGIPRGREVIFSPNTITVRYDVPIEQYLSTQNSVPYAAFVDYSDILRDNTGIISPSVELIVAAPHIKLKSVQPRTVSYYIVVTN